MRALGNIITIFYKLCFLGMLFAITMMLGQWLDLVSFEAVYPEFYYGALLMSIIAILYEEASQSTKTLTLLMVFGCLVFESMLNSAYEPNDRRMLQIPLYAMPIVFFIIKSVIDLKHKKNG